MVCGCHPSDFCNWTMFAPFCLPRSLSKRAFFDGVFVVLIFGPVMSFSFACTRRQTGRRTTKGPDNRADASNETARLATTHAHKRATVQSFLHVLRLRLLLVSAETGSSLRVHKQSLKACNADIDCSVCYALRKSELGKEQVFINSLSVRNILSFGPQQQIFPTFAGMNLFIGKNGSGKSNALRLIGDLTYKYKTITGKIGVDTAGFRRDLPVYLAALGSGFITNR